jgi:SAM-dependent methyltransferase
MTIVSKSAAFLKDNAPESVFRGLKMVYQTLARPHKHQAELDFWLMRFAREGNSFVNANYEVSMREMARKLPANFYEGKTVVDFGCGPCGTLQWLSKKSFCIGVDVLVDGYLANFESDMKNHNMAYVPSSETYIPLPDQSADIVLTMNSMDHVDKLGPMCEELLRVLKPGGMLLGSFNLDEEPTPTEPLVLTEALLQQHLFSKLTEVDKRAHAKRDGKDPYGPFFGRPSDGNDTGARIMWYAGKKMTH